MKPIAFLFLLVAASPLQAAQPNMVLIFVDNLGYGDFGCYGNPVTKTPHIDKLARQGVRCQEFYIASPSCMPSRGALMTGRHPVRNGLNEQIYLIDELEQEVLDLQEKLFPQYLKELGYATGCFGKWNLGFAPRYRPTERGFDEYLGNISGNCDYYTHIYNGRHDYYKGVDPVYLEGYSTDITADAACGFIRRHKDTPFFAYVPFNAAHYPNPKNKRPGEPALWQAPDWAFDAYGYDPSTLNERHRYRAVVTALDAGIGRIMDQLERLQLTKNTITIVLSDNGAFLIPGRGMECASNLPLKGGGTMLYEGGIRVPCIVRWPARLEGGTDCLTPLSSMDLLPMAIKAAGGTLPNNRLLDGKDPTEALAGAGPPPREYLHFHYKSSHAIRWGKWKMYRRNERAPWELYDLSNDVGETATRAAANPQLVRQLEAEHERWLESASRKSLQESGQ